MAAVATAVAQEATVSDLVLEQTPFTVHSSFWPNLNNVLWAEAWARRPASKEPSPAGTMPEPLTATLTAAERAAWEAAVKYYDDEIADLHPLFEMGPIRKAMLAARTELPAAGLEPDHRRVLTAAAAVYRRHWWAGHDFANRAWASDPMSKVASLSPAIPERLARLYGTPWFTRPVRVDVVRVTSREGAFTSIDPTPAYITIASGNPNMTGWMAAEVLFHEASHALAMPLIQAFGAQLQAQSKISRDLWHVALFYLTGEVVRQALEARNIKYEPYLYKTGLFDRAWPQYKAAIETHWKPYVDGNASRDDAIRNVVAAIK
ncbi:MAG TPA: hypothetical protein VES67_11785 [Vicinamibacterales bacterium]|nr:hypothetical protein [Vicinamibacterales bacterium]